MITNNFQKRPNRAYRAWVSQDRGTEVGALEDWILYPWGLEGKSQQKPE